MSTAGPDARKNLLAYYGNFITVAVVGIIVNPLLLAGLGAVYFGVWKALQRYLDLASVADGRATQALKWIVANRADLSFAEKRRDVGAAIAVWAIWLPIVLAIAVLITLATPLLINGFPASSASSVYWSCAILAGNLLLAGLVSIPDSVLVGFNKGYRSMLVTTAVFVVVNGVMVVGVMAGWGLVGLALTVVVGGLVNGLWTWWIARQVVPWWGASRPDRADLTRVSQFSALTLGWASVEKLLLASEFLVVSIGLGAAAVTAYTFTTYVLQFVLVIALITASGYMPRLGALVGRGSTADAVLLASNVKRTVFALTVVMGSGVLVFNESFVSAWVGADQYMGSGVNILLVLLALQLCLLRTDGQILDASLRIGHKVGLGACVALASIGTALATLVWSGSLEFALVAMLLVRMVASIGFPRLVGKTLPGTRVGTRSWCVAILLIGASIVMGMVVARLGIAALLVVAPLWCILVGLAGWFGLVSRDAIKSFLVSILSRLRRWRNAR